MMENDESVLEVLRGIIDPEIGINIVDLGLVYEAKIDDKRIHVVMTMTTPACPMGEHILEEVRGSLRQRFSEAAAIDVDLVWDPPWNTDMITEQAKEQLGWK